MFTVNDLLHALRSCDKIAIVVVVMHQRRKRSLSRQLAHVRRHSVCGNWSRDAVTDPFFQAIESGVEQVPYMHSCTWSRRLKIPFFVGLSESFLYGQII
jgi:hypothetical protein